MLLINYFLNLTYQQFSLFYNKKINNISYKIKIRKFLNNNNILKSIKLKYHVKYRKHE